MWYVSRVVSSDLNEVKAQFVQVSGRTVFQVEGRADVKVLGKEIALVCSIESRFRVP